MQTRDASLDVMRGAAIVLVVVGHYLQGSTPEFDANLGFRAIYAFHMPLFMFICGRAAAYKLAPRFDSASAGMYAASASLRELPHKAARLIVPFLAWGFIAFAVHHGPLSPSLSSHLVDILARPDLALWFLPVLFCIHAAVALAQAICRGALRCEGSPSAFIAPAIGLLIGWLALLALSQLYMLKLASYYYPFFCAGLVLALLPKPRLSPNLMPIFAMLCVAAFVGLLPFWHRTSVDPLLLSWLGERHTGVVRIGFAVTMAICGSVAFQASIDLCMRFAGARMLTLMRYLGSRTLAIYAIHLYFLGLASNAVAIPLAIFLSLAVNRALSQNRWTRRLLLGESHAAPRRHPLEDEGLRPMM